MYKSIKNLTLRHLLSLSSTTENNVLSLVPMKPTHRAVIHLEVELPALMTNPNGVKYRSTSFNVLQIDECSNSDSLSWLGLESIPVK